MQQQDSGTPDQNTTSGKGRHEFAVRVLIAVGIVAAVVLLLWLLGRALQVFLVLFAAVLFGVLLYNLSRHVRKLTRIPYKWALLLVVLLLFGVVIGGSFLLAPSLTEQGKQLAQKLPEAIQSFKTHISRLPFGEQILAGIPNAEQLPAAGGNVMQKALGAFSTTLGAITNFLIIIVIGIYLAANPKSMAEGIVKLLPISGRERAREVLYTLGFTLWGWLKGTLLAMVIISIVTSVGLSVIGVPLPLILGIIAGLFEFVPNIGPFVAGLPAVLLALMSGGTQALWVIGLFVAVQCLEGWVLTPLVQKKVIDLPPVLTISAQLLLGMLAGILGLILAVPLISVAMVLVKMLYIEDILGDKTIEVKGEEQAKKEAGRHLQENTEGKQ